MTLFTIKQHDLEPPLRVTLRLADGTPQDLTGATITFSMQYSYSAGSLVITDAPCTLTDLPINGAVQYAWQAGNTDVVGTYDGEFHVLLPTGHNLTFPTHGTVTIVVEPKLL